MIDGSFTEQEWQAIVEATGNDELLEFARKPLERAVLEYSQSHAISLSMKDSVRRRKQWEDVQSIGGEFLQSIKKIEAWDPASWGGTDDDTDPHRTRERLIKAINDILTQADFCVSEYDSFATGKSAPGRQRLYREVLRIWKEDLGKALTYTPGGPTERFFRSALVPILGDETPKGSSVRDIVNQIRRKQERHTQTHSIVS
jgi:hypothetical protein